MELIEYLQRCLSQLLSHSARMIDEAIDGLSDEPALFLPRDLVDSNRFITLVLCQVYPRSYLVLNLCQSQRQVLLRGPRPRQVKGFVRGFMLHRSPRN